MKIMFSAGEISGDLYASHLAKALKDIRPDLEMFGMGGNQMEKNGVRLIYNPISLSVVGLIEIIKAYPVFKKILNALLLEIKVQKPDVLVLVDFPGFNMRLGRLANKLGVPVVYFISPSAWAWREKRAKIVASWVTAIAAIFPFEADVYKKAGANVEYVGHPLVDLVESRNSKEEFCRKFGLQGKELILGLLPGSRAGEIERLLPVMMESAVCLKERIPSLQIFLPVAPGFQSDRIRRIIADYHVEITVIENSTYDLMSAADFLIVASGTATLEAAILNTPMLIIYKVAPLTAWLARRLLKIPYIGLPNIMAKERIVPELLQEKAEPASITEVALRYLTSPEARNEQRKKLKIIREKLGERGVFKRAAQVVMGAAGLHRHEPGGFGSN